MKINIKMSLICYLAIIVFSCSKNDQVSIVGKWYHASTSTKNIDYTNCALRDTTKTIAKASTDLVYEFKSDGSAIVTIYSGSTAYPANATYTFSNNVLNLTLTASGSVTSITLSNITSEGWSIQQDNRFYCPGSTKLGFKENLNFIKY